MLTARTFLNPRRRAWLPIAAGVALMPVIWYLASPMVLTRAVAPRSSEQLHGSGAFEVGQLKGNVGGQNYVLPADLDLSTFRSIVVYCRRFTTVFSRAELAS